MSAPAHLSISLEQPADESDIWVGPGVLGLGDPQARDAVTGWLAERTVFVVSSPTVLGLHGGLLEPIREAAARTVFLSVPDGEQAKSLSRADELWQQMLDSGGKRDCRLITFGGGSVGDLGGFVAACFMRGIEYIQIPTTLLAQVDAALGGKTAVDTPQGKNLVGAFHQPRYVLSDMDVLQTLPRGELRAGLVEAIKKAALLDEGRLFVEIEDRMDALLEGDAGALQRIVAGAARLKLYVVRQDEKEGGLRKVLNFGHTLAHAIEHQLAYSMLRHGEAVAYGMLFAVRLAKALGPVDDDLGERIHRMLSRFEMPELPVERLNVEGLISAMGRDKKASRKGLTWVLPRGLGAFKFNDQVPDELVERELVAFLDDPWAL